MQKKINVTILSFNEEARIDAALKCASTWAYRIFLLDKGSTDSTIAIARSYGAEIINLPFSAQGAEDYVEIHKILKSKLESDNPWYMWLTPGEVPTRSLIDIVNSIVTSTEYANVDVFCLPVRIMTFGKFRSWGPWGVSYQPRLVNSNLVSVQNKVHDHIVLTSNTLAIPESDQVNILHPTHVNFSKFIHTHYDYALNEEFKVSEDERVGVAIQKSIQYDNEFFNKKIDDDLRPLYAWKIYCYMVALNTLDKKLENETLLNIQSTKNDYLRKEWNIES